ncbi:hypothetical protein ACROYT_G023021 [Oculina patagonica]
MASNSSLSASIENWKKSFRKTRGLTGPLRSDLYSINNLYDKLLDHSVELFKFNFANDEEIIYKAGEVQPDSDKTLRNAEISKTRAVYEQRVTDLRMQIDEIISNRLTLLCSEIPLLRRKLKKQIGRKRKVRMASTIDGSYMEIRRNIKNFERFSLKRLELFKKQVTSKIEMFRRELEEDELQVENARKKSNLHNFTDYHIQNVYGYILGKSGGYVPSSDGSSSSMKFAKQFKHSAEAALLHCLIYLSCDPDEVVNGYCLRQSWWMLVYGGIGDVNETH